MPERTSSRIPKYRLHKPTGRAVVRLNGRDIYLGRHGTDESRQRYRQVIAEWLANNRQVAARREFLESPEALSVAELAGAYLSYAKGYYRKNGKPTGEVENIKDAVQHLVPMYAKTLAVDFGPSELRAVRHCMVDANLCRNVVNARVNRIRRIFKWAVGNQLVPTTVLQALQAVDPLKRGRSPARETDPVQPAPDEHIDEVLKRVPRQVAAMIQLQRLTGMRPGEATAMRTGDLDLTGTIWVYKPGSHKTEHHGRTRVIFIGPQAQTVLRPFLKHDLDAYIFNPSDSVREFHEGRREEHKSRSHRTQRRATTKPKYLAGPRYTRRSYAQAIKRACDRAFPPPEGLSEEEIQDWRREHRWSPNQLRHNAATFLRKEFGLEAARVVLGHASQDVTEIYAEADLRQAADIMAKVG
jgi:integrase